MGQVASAAGCIVTAVTMCNEIYKTVNQKCDEEDVDFDEEEVASENNTFVIICALDYKRTDNPLTCSIDGRNMESLVAACGIPSSNVRAMYDEECTNEGVSEVIREFGERMEGGDHFIFYYSGHGTNLKDQSGDEEDGQDEAFCFVTPDGQINYESCMSDDTFSELLTEAVDKEVKVTILTDCCHSGTICDFGTAKGAWAGRKAISITGCLDKQTSGDIGRGGIFTHSLMMAIAELQQDGEDEYTAAKVYNVCLDKDDEVFHSKQDICLQCSPGMLPQKMPWPLIPKGPYTPPYAKRGM